MAHLEPGTTIGPYRIDALVGSGGMGDVYRATDTRLHRTVALKLIAARFSSDPEARVRFEREGRLLAALNHPHIGAIHGVEEFDGVQALVLEFIDGPTLAERLDAGRLGVDDALAIARQIAAAVASAHDKGIIHRDLKPANIKITPGGGVKVLDFGIGKLSHPDDGLAGAAAETVTARQTQDGAVLGTAAYMSPEQARGQAIDKRTDIWAFGCVFYEMLSGLRPFGGGTGADTVAKILEREPAWEALPEDLPTGIRSVLRRCLKKNAAERWHDIADVELEIRDATTVPSASGLTANRDGRRRLIWIAGAVTLAALGFWLYSLRGPARTNSVPSPSVEFGVRFPDNFIPANGIAVSPDGRYIAASIFGNAPQIWLHSLESSETRRLADTESGATPFWSEDSKTLAFIARGQLRKLTVPNGQPTIVCDLPADTAGGTWNARNEIVFAAGGKLFIVSGAGDVPRPIPVPAGKYANTPRFLADGRHLIYTDSLRGIGAVTVTSVEGTDHRALVNTDAPATFAPPDQLLFVRGTALMAQRLDQDRLVLDGTPTLVASNVSHGIPLGIRASVSASASLLAYARPRGGSVGQLTWFERTGQAISSIPSPPDGEYVNPAISPDGQWLAVNRLDPQTGNWDIWKIDLAQGGVSRLTTDPAQDTDPVWSPDSKTIIFASDRGGRMGLYEKAVDGSRPEDLVLAVDGPTVLVPTDWSHDGKYVLYYQGRPGGWTNFALPVAGDRKPIHLFGPAFNPYGARLSPDGNWIAYGSFETGRSEVFVQRFLAAGQKTQVSQSGGVHPRWTDDGRELIYWAVPGGINAVAFESDGRSFRIGAPRTLVQAPVLSLIDARPHYDITRDGKRLLARQPAGPQGAGLSVILNWTTRRR